MIDRWREMSSLQKSNVKSTGVKYKNDRDGYNNCKRDNRGKEKKEKGTRYAAKQQSKQQNNASKTSSMPGTVLIIFADFFPRNKP